MRYLFVYKDLRTGGAETLMLRLCAHLSDKGSDVALCCSGGELLPQLAPAVQQLLYSKFEEAPEICRSWIARSKDPVTLVSYDPISAGLGLLIQSRNSSLVPMTHITGVLHPRAWFMDTERRDRVILNKLVASTLGFDHFFFMNNECRVEHQKRWNVDLSHCPIVPIGVWPRPRSWEKKRGQTLKVVSIGRLVDFKQYNLGIPTIVRQCLDSGLQIKWDIFGTGPLHEDVAEQVEKLQVSDNVRLRGQMNYREFGSTVLNYDVFVGLGTAALEAAMLGVPVATATDMEKVKSYGYFDELPFGNLGERQAQPPTLTIGQLLREFHVLDEIGRAKLSKRMHEAAWLYSISEVAEQLEFFAGKLRHQSTNRAKWLVSSLYVLATESLTVSLVRKLRDRLRAKRSERQADVGN